jgi:DNA-binding NarL/FixJ family response regulator
MAIRILIADDNTLVRRALRLALENRGHWEVVEAEDGEDAVQKAKDLSPDLVILDLAMPGMDGIRAARAISLQMPRIPIILHTLHWSPRVTAEASKAGVRRVVAKSDSATILGAVEELLTRGVMGYVATIAGPTPVSEINRSPKNEKVGDLFPHNANVPTDR